MSEMFCFQCEQTAGGKGCSKVGVCGKKPEVSNKQDELTCAMVSLARAASNSACSKLLLKTGSSSGMTGTSSRGSPLGAASFSTSASIRASASS